MHRKAGRAVTARIRPMELAFGPVPSRPLDRSLGVNPVREDEVCAFLAKAGADRALVARLLDVGQPDQTALGSRGVFARRRLAGHRKSDEAASP